MRKLLLLDGHSLIHRAYHAFPKTLTTTSGELTNAVYGFTRILLSELMWLAPTHAGVAFDLPAPTFRQSLFTGYKKSRVKPEDELLAQIPRVKEVAAALNIPAFAVEGFEADDLIGTLARQATTDYRPASPAGRLPTTARKVVILTSDRDLMQLIQGDQIVIKMPIRGPVKRQSSPDVWNETGFIKEWGFSPKLLIDYKALAGDPSDDIPGVKGIGKVTAKKLISEFGEINQIYQNIDRVKDMFGNKVSEKLIQDQEAAQLSKQLATIDVNSPIKLDWKAMAIHEYDKEKVVKLFSELNFKSLIAKLPNDSFEQMVQSTLFTNYSN